MQRPSISKLLLPLAFGLLSCNALMNLRSTALPTPTEPPPTIEIPEITPTIEESIVQSCPITSPSPRPLDIGVHSVMHGNILGYLNTGGDLDQLQVALQNERMLAEGDSGIIEEDFTGDGFYDIVISLIDPTAPSIQPVGTLFIYVCEQGSYQLASLIPPSLDWSVPAIQSSDDLNGDGVADIFLSQRSCGAHTCFERFQVLIWDGSAFINVFRGPTEDMPNPIFGVSFPPHPRIIVTATGYASIGAGPFRPFKREWAWDPDRQAFIPSSDIPLPSAYRVHALYDADHLARMGEYGRALSLYQEVIENDALEDWLDPDLERANLGAYAGYRRMLIYLLLEDWSASENAYTLLQNDYPPGSPGAAFAALAEAFWNDYLNHEDLTSACAAAQAYAEAHPETVLEPLYFGYANPTYEAEDLCPYLP